MVDRFSKSVHFVALPPRFTAYKSLFMDMVCKHHGFLRSLVSSRNPIFVSQFWQDLFKLCRMSTSYHPESDGQTEVLNRVLEQYLILFVHEKPSLWHKFLALAEWSYNTSMHSGIGSHLSKWSMARNHLLSLNIYRALLPLKLWITS